MASDMNNFYGYFPGGFIRELDIEGDRQDITGSIDQLILKDDFDLERYQRIEGIRSTSTDRASDLFDSQKPELYGKMMHNLKWADKFVKLRDQMIIPIYKKLLELGYLEKKLRG